MKLTFEEKATSKKFLEKRINTNTHASRNFDEWVLQVMPSLPLKANILDLGCGTGKQILLFSDFTTEQTTYYALDKSEESLKILKSKFSSPSKLVTISGDFLTFPKSLPKKAKMDLILSCYALYYCDDLSKLVELIYKYLKTGGKFWVVGPFKGTNKELFDVIKEIYQIEKKVIYSIDTFYKDVINECVKNGFKSIKVNTFENQISFTTIDDLMTYLKNTTFYNAKYEKELQRRFLPFLKKGQPFTVTKSIGSLLLEK